MRLLHHLHGLRVDGLQPDLSTSHLNIVPDRALGLSYRPPLLPGDESSRPRNPEVVSSWSSGSGSQGSMARVSPGSGSERGKCVLGRTGTGCGDRSGKLQQFGNQVHLPLPRLGPALGQSLLGRHAPDVVVEGEGGGEEREG